MEGGTESERCLRSLFEAMKPGGKVAVLEFGDDFVPGKTKLRQVTSPFEAAGFTIETVHTMLDVHDEHFVVFRRPEG